MSCLIRPNPATDSGPWRGKRSSESAVGFAGLRKKQARFEDAWYETRGRPLPGFAVDEDDAWADGLGLGVGRPRMPDTAVLLFSALRGYLGERAP